MCVTECCASLAWVFVILLLLEAALVTLFYSRSEAQGRYMYLLRGVLFWQRRHVQALQLVTVAVWSVERSCLRCTGATRRSRPILYDVGAPVVARQTRLLLLETCWSL